MKDVRIIIIDSGKLESIIVDGVEMEDISSIEKKPIQDWFAMSNGRDGWEGLVKEIRKIIDDEKAELNFEFQGPQERKAIFENCVRELGISANTNGQSADEIANRNMEEGEKYEHRGFYKQAYEKFLTVADFGKMREAQYKVAEYLYRSFQGEDIGLEIKGQDALARAIDYYEKAAMQGYYKAQFKLYNIFSKRKDWKEANRWLEAAVCNDEQTDTEALKRQAERYLYGRGIKRNKSEAFILYEKAAKKKDAEACYMLGDFCFYGWGIKPNVKVAVEWYEKAAEQRTGVFPGKAQKALADIFLKGKEVSKDIEKAAYWSEMLSNNQESDQKAHGAYIMGECYADGYKAKGNKNNDAEAIAWYEKAAAQGHIEAMVQAADVITYTVGDVIKDENGNITIEMNDEMTEQARAWYEKAAEKGHVLAMIRLADHYEDVEGLEEQTFGWYKKAADKNDAYAMFKTAECYEQGIGTKKDYEEALKLYIKAAEAGQEEAVLSAAKLLVLGHNLDDAGMRNVFQRCLRMAEQGNTKAMTITAKLYLNGKGTEKNSEIALEWYQKAADNEENPDSEACYLLAKAYEEEISNGKNFNVGRTVGAVGIAAVIPVANLVAIPTGIAAAGILNKMSKDKKYKEFLATDIGKTMMKYYCIAAQLGNKKAEDAIKKWQKYS